MRDRLRYRFRFSHLADHDSPPKRNDAILDVYETRCPRRRSMMRALSLAALLLTIVVTAPMSYGQKLPLADEAAADASWVRFKKRLQTAIEKRDRQYVLSIVDPNVRNQTQATRGIAQFRRQWELDTADSPLWRELEKALQLGSAYIKREDGARELCVPYLLGKWPDDVHPFKHGAVIARDTTVQAEPSTSSRSLGALSYEVVPVTDWEVDDKAGNANQKWVRIKYRNGEGYLPEEHIRSPVEQAACFVKRTNGWRMTGFAPAGGE